MRATSIYRIDLPTKKYSGKPAAIDVLPSSPMRMRTHVERFAKYFLREMHTGGLQFEAAEQSNSYGYRQYHGFLFSAEDRYVGAACFRHRPEQDTIKPWVFDWVWIHPYFRRQGHLCSLWPRLEPQFGSFRLSTPIFPAMKEFLFKHGHKAP